MEMAGCSWQIPAPQIFNISKFQWKNVVGNTAFRVSELRFSRVSIFAFRHYSIADVRRFYVRHSFVTLRLLTFEIIFDVRSSIFNFRRSIFHFRFSRSMLGFLSDIIVVGVANHEIECRPMDGSNGPISVCKWFVLCVRSRMRLSINATHEFAIVN